MCQAIAGYIDEALWPVFCHTLIMMFPKPIRNKSKKLLAHIRSLPCAVCYRSPPSDPSHIKSVGAGGEDAAYNVLPFCRACHVEWHTHGVITFLAKHPTFNKKLIEIGWFVENGKLIYSPELAQ